eukprot:TRINITY_DN121597_c0_g1_i1.p1 TRINITY_DN121597_c0_g1~~TRINITY_DN121597_c0_g1_i1.p1  ORF type:complete len:355 (-),score=126.65 TRINITY_DN121597_c0_g1_i1:100-1164(-)
MGRKRKEGGEDDDDEGAAPAGAAGAAGGGMPGMPGMMGMSGGMPGMQAMAGMPGVNPMAMMGMMGMMNAMGVDGDPMEAMAKMFNFGSNARKGMPTIHPMLMATNPMLAMRLLQEAMQEAQAQGRRPQETVGGGELKEYFEPAAPPPPPAAPSQQHEDADSDNIDPDVQELCDHFHIEERHVKTLNGIMKKRADTFEADIEKLYNKLEQANNPNGLLVVKMREMVDGTFVGMIRPCADLLAISKKFKLDSPAETKLADILGRYDPDRKKEYIKELEKHLEVAARPSAIVMLMLKKISDGMPLGKIGAPQPGSYAHRMKQEQQGGGRNQRSRSKRQRERSNSRRKKRSRSRSRRR